jgi:DNA-binding transcriptional LysR family regulator
MSSIVQFLPAPLKSFMTQHPNVVVRLGEDTSSGICRAVAENTADIGIVSEITTSLDLEVFPFRSDELILAVPEGHSLSERTSVRFSETLDHEFVGQNPESGINRRLVASANELGKALKIRINVASFDAQCLMIDAGIGIGVLPASIAAMFASKLRFKTIALEDAWAKRRQSICVRRYDSLSVAARLLVDFLKP